MINYTAEERIWNIWTELWIYLTLRLVHYEKTLITLGMLLLDGVFKSVFWVLYANHALPFGSRVPTWSLSRLDNTYAKKFHTPQMKNFLPYRDQLVWSMWFRETTPSCSLNHIEHIRTVHISDDWSPRHTSQAWFRLQANWRGIYSGQCGTGPCFSPHTVVFHFQYHSWYFIT